MARVEGTYPTPTKGVSTLAPRNRAVGQASLQENFRSDPVHKLTRRPPLRWVTSLAESTQSAGTNPLVHDMKQHLYIRDGVEYRIIVYRTGNTFMYVDNVLVSDVPLELGTLDPNDLRITTIGHTSYILDTSSVVAMGPQTDETLLVQPLHLNIVNALNYSETITIRLNWSDNGTATSTGVSYTSLAVGTDGADDSRATGTVATALADLIEELPGLHAVALSSSVMVTATSSTASAVQGTATTGQGDRSVAVINKVIDSTDGLPLYAVPGTIVTVQKNPDTNKGTFYLRASPTDVMVTVETDPNAYTLHAVVWTETRKPTEPYAFVTNTLPRIITYDETTNTAELDTTGWKERRTGDDDSCPVPEFVGGRINDISYFQNRLVFLSDNQVFMTETDDVRNWWKASAVQLLVTDPVSIASTDTSVDTLRHMIMHNRDLLVLSGNKQFKIVGDTAVTPQTAALSLTTSYVVDTTCPPVSMGNSIYYPIAQGDSVGIHAYSGQRETSQDFATAITHHVLGYLPGQCVELIASPNLEMLVARVSGSLPNELFIYEQFTSDSGEIKQKAWSKWVLPYDFPTRILHMAFNGTKLLLTCREGVRGAVSIVAKEIELYSRVATSTDNVLLDNYYECEIAANGVSTTVLPAYFPNPGDDVAVMVLGDGTDYPLTTRPNDSWSLVATTGGWFPTFDRPVASGTSTVVIGTPYKSAYRPTRPYVRTSDGIVTTADRIRIAKFKLSIVDTAEVSMDIISDYASYDTQLFNGRVLGGILNRVGEVPLVTRDIEFSYSQDADYAEAEFFTESHLPLTIAGISWNGQYNKTSRNI